MKETDLEAMTWFNPDTWDPGQGCYDLGYHKRVLGGVAGFSKGTPPATWDPPRNSWGPL